VKKLPPRQERRYVRKRKLKAMFHRKAEREHKGAYEHSGTILRESAKARAQAIEDARWQAQVDGIPLSTVRG
jgi:hypothetical protein